MLNNNLDQIIDFYFLTLNSVKRWAWLQLFIELDILCIICIWSQVCFLRTWSTIIQSIRVIVRWCIFIWLAFVTDGFAAHMEYHPGYSTETSTIGFIWKHCLQPRNIQTGKLLISIFITKCNSLIESRESLVCVSAKKGATSLHNPLNQKIHNFSNCHKWRTSQLS